MVALRRRQPLKWKWQRETKLALPFLLRYSSNDAFTSPAFCLS